MGRVTLSVLEGLERGHVYPALETPVTIGREEVNDVQLNDERVSRLHAKLQDDRGQIIFTDLNSTNGSRVNGHPVQLRVLRAGDQLQLGRCTLLFGSDEEIAERAKRLGVTVALLLPPEEVSGSEAEFKVTEDSLEPGFSLSGHHNDQCMLPLFHGERPPLPESLTTLQRAQLADVLMSVHEQLQNVVLEAAEADVTNGSVIVPWERFQNLLLLQRDLAIWLQEVVNPEDKT